MMRWVWIEMSAGRRILVSDIAKQDIFSTSFRRVFGITPRDYRSGIEPES